jgi:hypothetical protein
LCKLDKSLYGLKQAPCAWFFRLSGMLLQLGFHASQADVSLFIFNQAGIQIYVLIYVDDIIIISSSTTAVDKLLHQLRNALVVKDLGQLNYFLGVEVHHTSVGFRPFSSHISTQLSLATIGKLKCSEYRIKLF